MSLIMRAARSGSRRLWWAARATQSPQSQSYSAAPAPAGEDDDLVLQVFHQQQKSYRDLLEGMKKISVPLNLDPAAVKKYASDMEALKRKVGIPEMEEVFSATLNHQLRLSGGSIRKFLTTATEGVDLGDQAEVISKLFAALDKVEASTGAVTADNNAGLQAFEKEAARIAKEHKVDNLQTIKSQAITDMYTQQVKKLRDSAQEEIDLAKRRDDLEGIQVDVSAIKPKLV